MLFLQYIKLLPQLSKSVLTEIISLPNQGGMHISGSIHVTRLHSFKEGNELLTRGNDFVTRGNALVSCGNNSVACGSDLPTLGYELVSCDNDLLAVMTQ